MSSGLVYVKGADLLRDPHWLAQNSGWGSQRAGHAPVQGDEMRGVLMRMPPGQRSPWHGASGWPNLGKPFPGIGAGAIYLAVAGEVDFMAGGTAFPMCARDMLIVNAVVYSYANVGFTDALFWTLRNKVQGLGPGGKTAPSARIWDGDDTAEALIGSDQPYYGVNEPSHTSDELDRMTLIRWDEYRRRPIEWHGPWGHTWGAYPSVDADVSGRYLRIPPGQSAELKGASGETFLIGVEQSPLFLRVDGDVQPLALHDAAVIPAGTDYLLVNPERADVVVFEMRAA